MRVVTARTCFGLSVGAVNMGCYVPFAAIDGSVYRDFNRGVALKDPSTKYTVSPVRDWCFSWPGPQITPFYFMQSLSGHDADTVTAQLQKACSDIIQEAIGY